MKKNKKQEVRQMTDKQFKAFIEAMKIIAEQAKDTREIKNALDRIQSVLKKDPK